MTAPRDPIYPHWRIEPRAFGEEDVRRVWVRDDGVETMDPSEIEGIELDSPMETQQNEAAWLWNQIGKGRKYALPHRCFVDLYVIWSERNPSGTQIGFCRDVGETDKKLVRGILQGRPEFAGEMTWDRLMQWITSASLAFVASGQGAVELRFNPLVPEVRRAEVWADQMSAAVFWDRRLRDNPRMVRAALGRAHLHSVYDNLDDLLARYASDVYVGGRITREITVPIASTTDVAMLLWLASGLSLDAWHERLGLEFDLEAILRGEDELLTQDELKDLNQRSYLKCDGLRAKWSRTSATFKPGVPRPPPSSYFLAPVADSE